MKKIYMTPACNLRGVNMASCVMTLSNGDTKAVKDNPYEDNKTVISVFNSEDKDKYNHNGDDIAQNLDWF